MIMKFHPIGLADRAFLTEKFQEDARKACEYSFGNNFIWRKIYQVEAAEYEGVALIRSQEERDAAYSFPSGKGDKEKAIAALMKDADRYGRSLYMEPLVEADKELLESLFPGKFEITANRDLFDYLYLTERLQKLPGKKLHGKRNHIARFKDCGDWSYEPMSEANLLECREMNKIWNQMRNDKWNDDMEAEYGAVVQAMSYLDELALTGGVLRREGRVVGFSIGEALNSETYVVHIEKAYPDIQGAYPMMNQQFVLHECDGCRYVNREEDTGDEGLRKAKLSYGPDLLLEKYIAVYRGGENASSL